MAVVDRRDCGANMSCDNLIQVSPPTEAAEAGAVSIEEVAKIGSVGRRRH